MSEHLDDWQKEFQRAMSERDLGGDAYAIASAINLAGLRIAAALESLEDRLGELAAK